MSTSRRTSLIALLGFVTAGCGAGGGSETAPSMSWEAALVAQFYSGGHIGMIPLAFADALALALS